MSLVVCRSTLYRKYFNQQHFSKKKHATIQRKGLSAESEICKVSNTLKMGQIITVEFYKLCAYIKKLLSSNTSFALEYGRLSTEQRFWVKSHLPKNTLMAKKVVTPRDDVSFFVIISISSVREV